MTQTELYTLWIKEGEAALAAKKQGMIKELYKVSGLRQVVAILDAPSSHDLDMALAGLPFNKESGLLDAEITPIHPYEEYYQDMKKATA
jgi:muconolactone delta-isomerase